MGIRFGEMLRAARLEQGLTQSELGRDLYSTSYISLLETGHREPTTEIIAELADRLGLTAYTVEAWAAPASTDGAEYVLAELRAQQSWDVHEYVKAAELAEEAAGIAEQHQLPAAFWKMSFLRAESLRKLGDFAAGREVAAALRTHPLCAESPELSIRAETLLATCCQGMGLLRDAVAHARTAVDADEASDHGEVSPQIRVEALYALIAALSESDELDDAWTHCQVLSHLIDESSTSHRAGTAYWTIGNVAFMRDDPTEGLRYHTMAAEQLSPATDLALWAQFNKASAAMRLAAGIAEDATKVCIEKAELALSIVGGSEGEELELSLIRADWLYQTGEHIAAAERLERIHGKRDLLARHIVGEAELLMGKCRRASGEDAEALRWFDAAAADFTAAGAPERAAHTAALRDGRH